ncbi:Uu.00g112760.m01.CDS01 [Anthostomella pinea]|uniref:Uu.00g112760.m01.CDS01 n=1 Tax=Anthostomella pinea TaxID=933095 RepID=A0AAI8VFE6_9PEZI|nr:Uu.00g112760.m01.CDS01 [Anthostomella pinea]
MQQRPTTTNVAVAFGWATTHSFDFAVANPDYEEPSDLMGVIQQRMLMDRNGGQRDQSQPQEYLFRVVDPVEQTPFSGIDRMHEGDRCHPNTPEKKADKYKLYKLFDDPRYQARQIVYTYGFGDNWDHYMTITGRADATKNFVCLDGSGHGVAEDAGGVDGWADVKAAYRAARPSQEQRGRRDWFERRASNRDPRGLAGEGVHAWDRQQINRELGNLLGRFERMSDTAEARMAGLSLR